MGKTFAVLFLVISCAGMFAAAAEPSLSQVQAMGQGRAFSKEYFIQYLRTWETELKAANPVGVVSSETPTNEEFERDLTKEFILRLRFQIERRYTGDDASLIRILKFMLELEEDPGNRSLSHLTAFLRELIEAVQSIREPSENLARFIRQFSEASGLKNPLSAEEFLKSRAYLNARQTESAEAIDDDTWSVLSDRLEEGETEFEQGPTGTHPTSTDSADSGAPQATETLDNSSTDIDPELAAELESSSTEVPAASALPAPQNLR